MSPEFTQIDENPINKAKLWQQFNAEDKRCLKMAQGQKVDDFKGEEVTDAEYKSAMSDIPLTTIEKVRYAPDAEAVSSGVENRYPTFYDSEYADGEEPTQPNILVFAPLPFDEGLTGKAGKTKNNTWEKFTKDPNLAQLLVYSPKSGLTRGFSNRTGKFYELLPPIAKKPLKEGGWSFELKYPALNGAYQNKEWFASQLAWAEENFKAFLKGLPPKKYDEVTNIMDGVKAANDNIAEEA